MNVAGKFTLALRLVGVSCRVAAAALSFPVTCLFSRRVRHTVWRAYEMFFGSARAGVYPECSLGEIIRSHDPVQLVELHAKSYNVTETELLCLVALERAAKTTKAFEFGTADGRTSRNLAANLETGGLLLTLNIAPELDSTHRHDVPVGQRFLGTAEAARIQQLWGDSRHFDGSPYRAQCQCILSTRTTPSKASAPTAKCPAHGGPAIWPHSLARRLALRGARGSPGPRT